MPIFTEPFAPQMCPSCGRTQYHNSRPCAGALIVKQNHVLLVRRAVEPAKKLWDLPGGFLEPGEHPLEGMLREVKEETGLDVRVIGLLGVYMDRYQFKGEDFFTLNHYYIVEPSGGTLRADDDVDAFEWFDLDHLPDDNAIAFGHEQVVLRDLHLNRNAFKIVSSSD
ncbi:MAG: NUDIX domain-containing protein [Chloroflexi bacterium]|nr:NUDIX domain-containing protein [Chloroflexota bacterium]